jgi:hypothetical protein
MSRRHPDYIALPTPTVMRAGEDRFVPRHIGDRAEHHDTNSSTKPADTDPDHRDVKRVTARDQSIPTIARHVQIATVDQPPKPQSP